jgi:DNA-binding transcriptional LysR family regulator
MMGALEFWNYHSIFREHGMDRLEAMTVLLAVVEAGSLSAASRKLGMPLATVSRKISELEQHLKTRLLTRSARQLSLTDTGRAYVEASRRIVEEVDEAERAAMGEYQTPRGALRITAPIVFGRIHVLPVALDFVRAYPEVELSIVQSDHLLNLIEDRIDLAVRIGELPDSSLVASRVGATRRVVCASPDYLAARGRPKKPEQLAGHDCIDVQNLTTSGWRFVVGKKDRVFPVQSRLSVTTAEAAIDAAVAGAGITRVLSYMVDEARRAGRLEYLLEEFEPPPWPIHLVHAGQSPLPAKVRAFVDFTLPRLKARIAGRT